MEEEVKTEEEIKPEEIKTEQENNNNNKKNKKESYIAPEDKKVADIISVLSIILFSSPLLFPTFIFHSGLSDLTFFFVFTILGLGLIIYAKIRYPKYKLVTTMLIVELGMIAFVAAIILFLYGSYKIFCFNCE